MPGSTSTTSDVSSTPTDAGEPERSSTTPPYSGIEPPHTPLRPAGGGDGHAGLVADARAPPATSSTVVGRGDRRGRAAATWPSSAHVMASGHQSRLASPIASPSVVTVAHTSREPARASASSTVDAARCRAERTRRPRRLRSAMGGVGRARGRARQCSCGVLTSGPDRGVDRGLGQVGAVALVVDERTIRGDLARPARRRPSRGRRRSARRRRRRGLGRRVAARAAGRGCGGTARRRAMRAIS